MFEALSARSALSSEDAVSFLDMVSSIWGKTLAKRPDLFKLMTKSVIVAWPQMSDVPSAKRVMNTMVDMFTRSLHAPGHKIMAGVIVECICLWSDSPIYVPTEEGVPADRVKHLLQEVICRIRNPRVRLMVANAGRRFFQ